MSFATTISLIPFSVLDNFTVERSDEGVLDSGSREISKISMALLGSLISICPVDPFVIKLESILSF